jgi:glycosyltransferase involved in cell wall biosynthesis
VAVTHPSEAPKEYPQAHNVVAQTARHHTPGGHAEQPRRIAMLAPPWIPVPPPGYGGIEEVVALLCDALIERGHDVELFCAPGSSSAAKVRPLLPRAHPESIERSLIEADHVALAFAAFDEAAVEGHSFDVVHDHCGFTPLAMADRVDVPLVHTVHGPFDDDSSIYYSHHASKGDVVCISHSQAGMAPDGVPVAGVVHNPIDVDRWPVGLHKDDYLLWLGRFVAEKGPQRAIRVAKMANRPLVLAGTVQPRQERFFATEIQPHIDGEQIRFVGEAGGARKQQLFADAFAFLMPIRWPEPFGMVMVESLAAGTPVLAFDQGAAPEIVDDGRNGFLVQDEEEMAARLEAAGQLDPMVCRGSAERFSPDRVAARYEAMYERAMADGRGRRPVGRSDAHGAEVRVGR